MEVIRVKEKIQFGKLKPGDIFEDVCDYVCIKSEVIITESGCEYNACRVEDGDLCHVVDEEEVRHYPLAVLTLAPRLVTTPDKAKPE